MKHSTNKRHWRDSTPGTHDHQISLFEIAVTSEDIEASQRHTREGIRQDFVQSIKRKQKLTASFKPKRVRKQERKKALQYSLRMRERTTDRVVDYIPKPACSRNHEARQKGNQISFTKDDVLLIHQKLMWAFQNAFANNWANGSARCMELVVWMTANRPDEPFSFETCCYACNIDPEIVKSAILKKVRERYKGERLHYDVFRQAIMDVERGDSEALAWLNDESTAEFSFLGLCKLFEFDPVKAKAAVRIPPRDAKQVA